MPITPRRVVASTAVFACITAATAAFAATPPAASTPARSNAVAPPSATQSALIERRAVDAALWGMPTISFDAMRQAYFRDGKANYGDIIWWPEGNGWKNQSLTPNTSVRYLYVFFNTKDGPVMFDVPAAANGSSLLGTIGDAWQLPLVDVGTTGKAERYVILPPGYKGSVPSGRTPLRPTSFNTFLTIRSILAGSTPADRSNGDALVKQVHTYPTAKPGVAAAQRLIDMTSTPYDGLVHYDASLYANLARMVAEEPAQPQDMQQLGMLLPLGIARGVPFKPDAATTARLKSGAATAHAWLLASMPGFASPFWPGSTWTVPVAPVALGSKFSWKTANYTDIDARALGFAGFFLPPATLGAGSFYLGTSVDASGAALAGRDHYTLHVSANVPVSQFWSVTTYSTQTNALFPNIDKSTVSSLDPQLQKNSDGSVDIHFGPKAPAGKASNWIQTPAGQGWFVWFRFYGPQKAVFDKSWTMPGVVKAR